MNQKDIKTLLNTIVTTEQIVNEDLSGWDSRTATGKHMAKRMAQDSLAGLLNQYRVAVFDAAVGILLEGSAADQTSFAELAEDEASTITVDAGEMYLAMAKKVFPSIGSDRLFTTTQSALMFEAIEEVATVVSAPMTLTNPIGTPPATVVRSEQECAALIRTVIRKDIKDALNKLFLENKVVEKALAVRYNSNVVPVVITNAAPEEVDGLVGVLFTGRNFPVKLTGNVSKDSVLKTLLQIKKKINPNTTTKTN